MRQQEACCRVDINCLKKASKKKLGDLSALMVARLIELRDIIGAGAVGCQLFKLNLTLIPILDTYGVGLTGRVFPGCGAPPPLRMVAMIAIVKLPLDRLNSLAGTMRSRPD